MLAGSRAERPVLLAVCALTTFLGALLSFDLEPLVGRHLLPQLGGAPGVWVSCLAFFQAALFVGYLVVHAATRKLSLQAQLGALAIVLGAVLGRGPLLLTPVADDAALTPVAAVSGFLLQRVALSFIALAMTAPLLQRWYARTTPREPYALYALSNAGSLLGLLAYPFVVEPLFDLSTQARLWSWLFRGYACLMLLAGALVLRTQRTHTVLEESARTPPSRRQLAAWLLLSAAPSALLVATSNHITIDVAPTPLLWVVPLALYLVTFIVAFSRLRARSSELWPGLLIACTVALPILLMPGNQARLSVLLVVPLATLFAGAMVCHQKLAELRPEPAELTTYYVMIAAGGALGGGLVAFVAPLVFVDLYELVLSLLAVYALQFTFSKRRDRTQAPTGRERLSWLGFGLAVPVLLATLVVQTQGLGRPGQLVARTRNFFGPLQVLDTAFTRVLIHGRTDQGQALRAAGKTREPIGYVGPDSAVARAFRWHAQGRARSLGVVGLGIGALAAYATPEDTLRFYEINADMVTLAHRYFSFLDGSRAHVTIELGDGRVSLAREHNQFDILVLDVFSSDAVPPHLLTREAFALYERNLAPSGVLVVNVSNRHLRLERVVLGSARANHLACVVLETPEDKTRGLFRARWALIARTREELAPLLTPPVHEIPVSDPITWTDDRSSLLSILL